MEQTAIAKLRHAHVPPRKMRLQADVIRGLSVAEAEAQLMLSPRRPAALLQKLLRSAEANATFRKMETGKLYVKEIRVDQGPKQKRATPRAQGSMNIIEKRTSHVTIVLGLSDKVRVVPFLIHRHPKKTKTGRGAKPQKKETAASEKKLPKEKEGQKSVRASEPGVFKKMFRRKSI